MKTKQNRKWALKPEVGIFETRDPAQAEGKLLRIILSYSTALCMVWVKPQFDSNLRQKHPIFGLWEFLENSRGTLEGKFINVFDSTRQALSDPKDSLVTKILLVVENFSLSQFIKKLKKYSKYLHSESDFVAETTKPEMNITSSFTEEDIVSLKNFSQITKYFDSFPIYICHLKIYNLTIVVNALAC